MRAVRRGRREEKIDSARREALKRYGAMIAGASVVALTADEALSQANAYSVRSVQRGNDLGNPPCPPRNPRC